MNGLFGLELPTSVNFVIAFVVVLALIGAATWVVRRFGVTRLEAGGRGRQPRLAVIDSAAVDGRRKLVIIRRDNVEHLLMIGGPTDVVVETNIVRSGAAAVREAPAVRINGGETLLRAMPLSDMTTLPLQPEPAVPTPAAAPIARTRPADDAAQWPMQAETSATPTPLVRAQRSADPLAGQARPSEPAAAPRPATAPIAPVRPAAPKPAPVVTQADSQAAAASDQNLANMAHQLEAALRRPAAAAKPAEPKRIEPKLTTPAQEPAPRAEPKPAGSAMASAAPAAAQPKPTYESIEEEMASLLGRPGKT